MAKSQSVGSLKVLLTLATAQFSRGIKTAQQQLAEFSKFALKSSAVVGGSLLAGGAAAAVFAKRAADSADALVKMSDSLGIASENMAGFKLAADLAGASIEGVERGIILFQKALSEAKTGSKQAKEAFAFLNLDPAKLAAMAPDEGFLAVVDALNQIGNQADRTRAAMELFGKSSRDVIKIVNSQSSSVRESIKLTQQLGTALNRVDANKIEQANDAITTMKEAWRGVATQLALRVAPMVTGVANAIVDAVKETNGFRDAIKKVVFAGQVGFASFAQAVQSSVAVMIDSFALLVDLVGKVVDTIDELRVGINATVDSIGTFLGEGVFSSSAQGGGKQPKTLEDMLAAEDEKRDPILPQNAGFDRRMQSSKAVKQFAKDARDAAAALRNTATKLWNNPLFDNMIDWFISVEQAADEAGRKVRDFFKNRAKLPTGIEGDFGEQKKKPFEIGFMRLDPVNFGLLKTDALFGAQRGETVENEQLMTLKQILDATRGVSRDVRGLTVPG